MRSSVSCMWVGMNGSWLNLTRLWARSPSNTILAVATPASRG
ncbi:hypothetical protein QT971_00790 [Microcoleus sp. herbarium19]